MHPVESRIIPDPMHAEAKVQLILPPEIATLATDLHNDRAGIAGSGIVLLICLCLLTWKKVFGKAAQ